MSLFLPILGVGVTILAGWAMIRRYQTHIVLLFSGLVLVAAAAFLAGVDILPKGVKSSGFAGFDIFNLLVSIGKKQASGIGFLIMAAGGFAAYMERIGAANALVRITVSPLRKLNSPYLVLVLGYLIGQMLVMVIPSAAGLAMLLLVALYPILKGVGVSPAAAVAVIGTSAGMTLGPSSGTANLAAKVAGLDPIIYFVQYRLPVAIPTLIAVAAATTSCSAITTERGTMSTRTPIRSSKRGAVGAGLVRGLPASADCPDDHLLETRHFDREARHDRRTLPCLGARDPR